MTTGTELSRAIAIWLARMWRCHKTEQFLHYIACTYGAALDRTPCFDCIYIAEAESGDLKTGRISSSIKNWWKVDDAGLSDIRVPDLPHEVDFIPFDRCPVLKFFTDGHQVVLGERLGPDLVCRKVGTLTESEACLSVADIELLWTSNSVRQSLGGTSP